MLTRSQMITEATRRLNAGENPDTVLEEVFGRVLNAATYAAGMYQSLREGNCDADDLIRVCRKCAEVIAEEVYEDEEGDDEEGDDEEWELDE